VTRLITLAPIFSDLSPLELRIFLKNTILYCYFFISKKIKIHAIKKNNVTHEKLTPTTVALSHFGDLF
jgi:hypothetical protein